MKRFLLWIIGVIAAVVLFLGIVIGFSWFSVSESSLPQMGETAFNGETLQENGSAWQVPLLGAMADKVFYTAETLTVQKDLSVVDDAQPAFTLPEWCNASELTITKLSDKSTIFSGSVEEYQSTFTFPENGTYEAVLRTWRIPEGTEIADEQPDITKKVVKHIDAEAPAKPVGYYSYRFRFTLSANPRVELSDTTIKQGGTLCLIAGGMLGADKPVADTDLGTVAWQQEGGSWRGYLGVAYNAEAGAHVITITQGEQKAEATVVVTGRQYGTAVVEKTESTETASKEFRNKIWPLYTADSCEKKWNGRWQCPVNYTSILVDYGVVKIVDGTAGSKSNSTLFACNAGDDVVAPAGGVVVFAGYLELTGNTVVIDHGCGVRSYLYGLEFIGVEKGMEVLQNGVIGTASEQVTLDIKIGNKSVCPWDLFQGNGGLFYKE